MKFAILFLIAGMFTTACQKERLFGDKKSEIRTENKKNYYNKTNDMLVFTTFKDLKDYVNLYNLEKPITQINKNFISLATILNKVVDSEMVMENKYEKLYKDKELSSEELQKINEELDSKPLENITKKLINEGS